MDPSAIVVKQYSYDNFFVSLFSLMVFKAIWFRVMLATFLSVALVVLQYTDVFEFPVVSTTGHTLISLAVGLLLVFRNNSGYARCDKTKTIVK